ncbi:carboxypeptidase-like regulatory domain-containing protein [Spirosoma fluviale]|uniref:carboxypeptidase-like regulatory domain-containing protein n=1 Tax=Spirosoma fluviale TaxID=1597977 RepID=UPI0015C6F337|nr:carboxypeptidase-like regulatory domain-containing protein [Spirosoma fluviale]
MSLFVGLTTSALSQTTITGSVRDATGKPLPFISIALLNARDSSLITGTISKETGSYTFENIKPGQYKLMVSAVGYAPNRTRAFDITSSPTEIPAISLTELAKTLNAVAVVTSSMFAGHSIRGYSSST